MFLPLLRDMVGERRIVCREKKLERLVNGRQRKRVKTEWSCIKAPASPGSMWMKSWRHFRAEAYLDLICTANRPKRLHPRGRALHGPCNRRFVLLWPSNLPNPRESSSARNKTQIRSMLMLLPNPDKVALSPLLFRLRVWQYICTIHYNTIKVSNITCTVQTSSYIVACHGLHTPV